MSARLGKYISNEHSLDVFEDEYGLVNENLLRWVRRLRRMSMGIGEDKEEALEAQLMVRRCMDDDDDDDDVYDDDNGVDMMIMMMMMVLIMDESLIPDVYHRPCSLHSSIISSTTSYRTSSLSHLSTAPSLIVPSLPQ